MKSFLIPALMGVLITPAVAQTLTADEATQLTFMREEEKLARDVYQHLYAKWNLRIFANIARSEQRHFEMIGAALARYGAADPAANTAAGVFVNERLQALYNELTAKGAASVKDALEVGVLIEKVDIADLEQAVKGTDKVDLKQIYTNLLAASLNHQEAFENTLEVVNR
jgi:hypothetical protein